MNIDAHQHFWKYNPREYSWIDDSMQPLKRDFLPEHLKSLLDRNGFQACIAVQARQTLDETQWLLELAERHPFIAGVVGWVDLRSPEVRAQLESFARHPKLVGVRHIVQAEPNDRFMLEPEFLRGIAMLEEFDLAYDILIYPRHLPVAAGLVKRFERVRFVLDHLAKPDIKAHVVKPWSRAIRELAAFPNAFCKLSGLVTEADWLHWHPADLAPYLDVALECFGPDRLMIGSDWPVCTMAGDYSRVMNIVKDWLPPSARDAVLGGNAERFWRLEFGTRGGSLRSLTPG